MGWWTRSTAQTPSPQPQESSDTSLQVTQPPPTADPTPNQPTAEDEILHLRYGIPPAESTTRPSNPSKPPSSSSPQSLPPDRHGIVPYPITMSCSTAFDQAFYCQSLGGQFINMYRYGGVRDCSETWSRFWFCMKQRQYGAERRAELVQDYYRRRDEERYGRGKPSSEDVWEPRTEKLTRAFGWDPVKEGVLEPKRGGQDEQDAMR